MKELDFFYFFGSGYAYLAVMRIDRLAEAANVKVNWRPFSVRVLMIEQGNMIRNQPQKMAYTWRDIARRAAKHGVPFKKPPIWPTDPDQLANRVGTLAMMEGWCPEYTRASFRAWYLDDKPLGDPNSLADILTPLGKDPRQTIEKANSPEVGARYDAETDFCRQRGAFGSPTLIVGPEIFWGDDRLEEAIAWAAGTHPAQLAGIGRGDQPAT